MNVLARGGGLLAVILVVVGGTAGLGAVLGLGATMILAGLTALFCFLAANGGPLVPDLKLLAAFAPAVVLGAAGPRLLGEVSQVAAIALLVVVVFCAALLPALGARYVTVGLGIGLASVFGYGFQLTGVASAGQILGAPALAIGVVFVLRLLTGLGDPGKPTRVALADALAGPDRESAERAVRLWLADRPLRWQARVVAAGVRCHATTAVLRDRLRVLDDEQAAAVTAVLDAVRTGLDVLAEAVRAKTLDPAGVPELVRVEPDLDLPGDTRALIADAWTALDAVREAVVTRDESLVDFPRHIVRTALRREATGALPWRSAQLRHAVRCALGMLVAVVIASLRPGDPLTVSFLMTTFGIMQPEWRDTLAKVWQRVAGSVAGAGVLALALWLLPHSALLPLGLVALLVGFPFLQAKPLVFNGCVVLMSVSVNAVTKHLDPGATLVEYVLLVALAVAIALLFGFAAVPGVPKPSVAQRFSDATAAMGELLGSVAARLRGAAGGDAREVGPRFRAAVRTHQDLLAPEPGSRGPESAQREALDESVEGLRGLAASAGAMLQRGTGSPALAGFTADAAAALAGEAPPPARPELPDEEERLIADLVLADVLRVTHGRTVLAAV
ncbi:FUSC family protein [Amycolatopsis rhabdoformis]|uniref:FUSC family protein n=1 Tax=Amycolatopsis rhabdoformis TaxID=1448059 RepID=A0ABZ1IKH6_9PSEU|nr:FUSC family protein [Amycolatopsis rhabdoformis]WSE34278.1 FUSC family protein [Amycolatopsis rhabdoformis]